MANAQGQEPALMAQVGQPRARSWLWRLGLLGSCLFLWPAAVTFDLGDWPSPHQYPNNHPIENACGVVGAWLTFHLRSIMGIGVYPLLLFTTLGVTFPRARWGIGSLFETMFGVALLIACSAVSMQLILGPSGHALPIEMGGMIGYALAHLLTTQFSKVGTIVVLASCTLAGLIFATHGRILQAPFLAARLARSLNETLQTIRRWFSPATTARALPWVRSIFAPKEPALVIARPSLRVGHPSRVPDEADAAEAMRPSGGRSAHAADKTQRTQTISEKPASDHHAKKQSAPEVQPTAPARKAAAVPIINFPTPDQSLACEPYPHQIENWTLPPLGLLHETEYNFTAQQEVFVRRQAKVLEETLQEFRLDASVVEIDTGPVITMFELKLGAGVKVSQIAGLSNDIARALKAHAIRVVAPISGKNTVGVEVPNLRKERVRLRELMTLAGGKATEMGLPLFLGKDAAGAALVADLTAMPHLLIAGTTGSGKSVCLNSVILSLLMTQRPDRVKMILIDPKMVEMSQFKDVPHLMCPIVTEIARAEKILEWAVTKMEERYELLAEARVKNVDGFNALGTDELYARFEPANEQEKTRIPTQLPYIVIVIDELADLMMTAAKEVEHHLSRLAQKSRAVGIHIIVATQRPEVKVVTGLIKSNMPARICFRVASRMDSRIVLDQNGGEVLMGQGDMLFLPPGQHKLIRAQGTFLEDDEIHAVLSDLASRAKPEFHPELIRLRTTDAAAGADLRDPLFDEAVRIILESKRGSVSLLQRRLTVGYSRASRLIDQMAEAGIVGDYKGSQAREVLMTLDQWDILQAQADADGEAGYERDRDHVRELDYTDSEPTAIES